jgi:hypothetical protein
VYAIWVPFLGGSEDAIDTSIMSDERVQHIWDGSAVSSEWSARDAFDAGIGYDYFLLYGPAARWSETEAPALAASGATIIGRSEELRSGVDELLSS